MAGKVRLKDIAEALNTTTATVSMALRGTSGVSERMRDRVKQKAEEMGYRPNALVSTLMADLANRRGVGREQTLAFITAFEEELGWQKWPSVYGVYQEAERRASALGYRLEHFWYREPGMTAKRFNQILKSRGIVGVVIAPMPNIGASIDLEWKHFAAVASGIVPTLPNLDRVVADFFRKMQIALNQAVDRGYRRVAYFYDGELVRDERIQLGSYLAFPAEKSGITLLPPLAIVERDASLVHQWLRKYRPDVILHKFSDDLCDYYFDNRSLGTDVAFDLIHLNVVPGMGEMGVDGCIKKRGVALIDFLISKLHRNERGIPESPQAITISPDWQEGK